MKKFLGIFMLFAILLTAACNAILDQDEIKQTTEESQPMQETADTPSGTYESGLVKSNAAREMSPEVNPEDASALVKNNSQFAFKFYEQIRQGSENIIFSPISLSLALSMTLAGADSATENALSEALQLTLPEENVHPAFNSLLMSLEDSQKDLPEEFQGNKFQLNIANSIWTQVGYDFKQNFLDILARHYGAGIYNVDYKKDSEAARLAINDWIEEETKDKIKDLVPPGAITPLTRLVLANAIYFYGSWFHPFDEAATADAPFTLLDGSEKTVDMMSLSGEGFPYAYGDNYQAIQLPYLSQDFVMTILLPDQDQYLDFEANLDSEKFAKIMEIMAYKDVDLKMPKFDFTSSIGAKNPLIQMGMGEAFDADRADFSAMTDTEELFISDVLHKATITVDEQGTEAAAATAVIMRAASIQVDPIPLVLDRPFMFFIQHQPTGTILFMGRVVEP